MALRIPFRKNNQNQQSLDTPTHQDLAGQAIAPDGEDKIFTGNAMQGKPEAKSQTNSFLIQDFNSKNGQNQPPAILRVAPTKVGNLGGGTVGDGDNDSDDKLGGNGHQGGKANHPPTGGHNHPTPGGGGTDHPPIGGLPGGGTVGDGDHDKDDKGNGLGGNGGGNLGHVGNNRVFAVEVNNTADLNAAMASATAAGGKILYKFNDGLGFAVTSKDSIVSDIAFGDKLTGINGVSNVFIDDEKAETKHKGHTPVGTIGGGVGGGTGGSVGDGDHDKDDKHEKKEHQHPGQPGGGTAGGTNNEENTRVFAIEVDSKDVLNSVMGSVTAAGGKVLYTFKDGLGFAVTPNNSSISDVAFGKILSLIHGVKNIFVDDERGDERKVDPGTIIGGGTGGGSNGGGGNSGGGTPAPHPQPQPQPQPHEPPAHTAPAPYIPPHVGPISGGPAPVHTATTVNYTAPSHPTQTNYYPAPTPVTPAPVPVTPAPVPPTPTPPPPTNGGGGSGGGSGGGQPGDGDHDGDDKPGHDHDHSGGGGHTGHDDDDGPNSRIFSIEVNSKDMLDKVLGDVAAAGGKVLYRFADGLGAAIKPLDPNVSDVTFGQKLSSITGVKNVFIDDERAENDHGGHVPVPPVAGGGSGGGNGGNNGDNDHDKDDKDPNHKHPSPGGGGTGHPPIAGGGHGGNGNNNGDGDHDKDDKDPDHKHTTTGGGGTSVDHEHTAQHPAGGGNGGNGNGGTSVDHEHTNQHSSGGSHGLFGHMPNLHDAEKLVFQNNLVEELTGHHHTDPVAVTPTVSLGGNSGGGTSVNHEHTAQHNTTHMNPGGGHTNHPPIAGGGHLPVVDPPLGGLPAQPGEGDGGGVHIFHDPEPGLAPAHGATTPGTNNAGTATASPTDPATVHLASTNPNLNTGTGDDNKKLSVVGFKGNTPELGFAGDGDHDADDKKATPTVPTIAAPTSPTFPVGNSNSSYGADPTGLGGFDPGKI